jgi:phosphohistidine phosphatase
MPTQMHSIYLVRHAIAEERGDKWPDDTKRPLTSKGMARMREIAAGLRELGVKIDLVLTSPLVRAKQTAELLVHGLKPAPSLTVISALSPGVSPARLAEAIESLRKSRKEIAMVGHEPDLGQFAAWLIGAKAPLIFKKGGVCRIDLPAAAAAGAGHLVWFATPKMLRALD